MRTPTATSLDSSPTLESIDGILSSRGTLSSGAGKRIAFYSHDTLGLGHLRRTLKIARGVTRLFPEISALIISGSPDVGLVTNNLSQEGDESSNIDVVKLPSVKKLDDEKYSARFLPDAIDRIVAIRTEIILSVVKKFEPHLLLVDHAPVGMRGELRQTFAWLNQRRSATKVVYGMRDIIDDAARISGRWEREGIYDTLEKVYDAILIYGDPRLALSGELYRLPPSSLKKATYCGYISDYAWREKATHSECDSKSAGPGKRVVVTIGGGDYYGPEIVGGYLKMLKEHKAKVDFDSVVITGPLLNPELFYRYQRLSAGLPVSIYSSVERIAELLLSSDLLITTAGYNSAVDALSYARRALMAPRKTMRKEQIMRVTALAKAGAVDVLDPQNTTSQELYEMVTCRLNRTGAPLASIREEGSIDLDGSRRAAVICGRLLELVK